jgi:hypothetical protein
MPSLNTSIPAAAFNALNLDPASSDLVQKTQNHISTQGKFGNSSIEQTSTNIAAIKSHSRSSFRSSFASLTKSFKSAKSSPSHSLSASTRKLQNNLALEKVADKIVAELLDNHGIRDVLEEAKEATPKSAEAGPQIDTQFKEILKKEVVKALKTESKFHNKITKAETALGLGINAAKGLASLASSSPIVGIVFSPILLSIQGINIGRRLVLTSRTNDLKNKLNKLKMEHSACHDLLQLTALKLKTVASNDNKSTALKTAHLVAGITIAIVSAISLPFAAITLPVLSVVVTGGKIALDIALFAKTRPARMKTKYPHLVLKDTYSRSMNTIQKRQLKARINKAIKKGTSLKEGKLPQDIKTIVDSGEMTKIAVLLKKPQFITSYTKHKMHVKSMQNKRADANIRDMLRGIPLNKGISRKDYAGDYKILAENLVDIANNNTFNDDEKTLLKQILNIDVDDDNFSLLDPGQKKDVFLKSIEKFTGMSYQSIYRTVNAIKV